jgi:hypothetical protein
MSIMALERVDDHTRYNRKTKEREEVKGQPGYYAVLPLSVPADIATAPIQLVVFMILVSTGQVALGH